MKRMLLIPLLFLMLPSIAYASVTAYDQQILFRAGTNHIKIDIGPPGGVESNSAVKFFVKDRDTLTVSNHRLTAYEDFFYVTPAFPGTNQYGFWNIQGQYQNRNFLIVGYTIDVGGDTWFERNSLFIDVTKVVFLTLVLAFLTLLFIKDQKKRTRTGMLFITVAIVFFILTLISLVHTNNNRSKNMSYKEYRTFNEKPLETTTSDVGEPPITTNTTKIYTSTDNRISFTYPSNLTVTEDGSTIYIFGYKKRLIIPGMSPEEYTKSNSEKIAANRMSIRDVGITIGSSTYKTKEFAEHEGLYYPLEIHGQYFGFETTGISTPSTKKELTKSNIL